MSQKPKILAFAGSLRLGSFNKMLLRYAIEGAEAEGAEVTYVDLLDLDLPLYNADDEAIHGLPDGAKKLKGLMIEHDAFLIASPEYNSAVSGALKNAIDWASRPEESDPYYLVAYKRKMAAIMSASPGNLGGLRGLIALRTILGNIGILVLPEQVTVSKANEVFDKSGTLTDEKKRTAILELGGSLAHMAQKIFFA